MSIGRKTEFTPEELAKDYMDGLINILKDKEKIKTAVKGAEIIKGRPTLDTIRAHFDENGSESKENPPIYIDKKRTDDQCKHFALQGKSDLEAIIIASAYFEAGSDMYFKYNVSRDKAQEFTNRVEATRTLAASELKNYVGIQDYKQCALKQLDEKDLKEIQTIIKLRVICQNHLDVLKAKNPKNNDVTQITALLQNLSNTSVPATERISAFLRDMKQSRKAISTTSAIFKKATGDKGLYGLWQKVKPTYKEQIQLSVLDEKAPQRRPSGSRGG